MAFTEYTAQSQLKRVKYGIAEVAEPTVIYPTTALDLVITPLVGFDENANRMGWGQGHYDRTFEFLQQRSRPTTPFLLGIAYECQKVEALTTHDWDVPLDMIITEKIIYYGEST
jgi:5-formyltetrahydrofolate cyclo-ligase